MPIYYTWLQLLLRSMVELNNLDRNHTAIKPKIFTILPFTEKVCQALCISLLRLPLQNNRD